MIRRQRSIWNWIGGGIVILWMVLMAVLIRKVELGGHSKTLPTDSAVPRAIESHQRDWLEIYLKDQKIGYAVSQISPIGDGYLVQEEMFLSLNMLGNVNTTRILSRAVVNDEFLLKSFRFRMDSGVVSFRVAGNVTGDKLELEVGGPGERRSETIQLSTQPLIPAAMSHFFKGRDLALGQSFTFPLLDPASMATVDVVATVESKETLRIGRIPYEAFRLDAQVWGHPVSIWLDSEGSVLKETGFMGMSLVKSSAANAPLGIEGAEGRDLYELAAIPVDRKIGEAHRIRWLRIRLRGLEGTEFDTAVLNSGRQKFQSGVMEITQEQIPRKPTYLLPRDHWPETLKPYLLTQYNVQSDHPAILARAREIVGNGKDPRIAATRLMTWVHTSVAKKPVITVPSALEVLRTKVGDCNEHSVLLNALLRAVGIPARACAGLVFSRGRFFFHAWNECYVGDWVSMDSTLNQMPTDATHVKLTEGGLDRQGEMIALMGTLKLEVLDYGYD